MAHLGHHAPGFIRFDLYFHYFETIQDIITQLNRTATWQNFSKRRPPDIREIVGAMLKINKLIAKYEMTNLILFSIKVMIEKAIFVTKVKNKEAIVVRKRVQVVICLTYFDCILAENRN